MKATLQPKSLMIYTTLTRRWRKRHFKNGFRLVTPPKEGKRPTYRQTRSVEDSKAKGQLKIAESGELFGAQRRSSRCSQNAFGYICYAHAEGLLGFAVKPCGVHDGPGDKSGNHFPGRPQRN